MRNPVLSIHPSKLSQTKSTWQAGTLRLQRILWRPSLRPRLTRSLLCDLSDPLAARPTTNASARRAAPHFGCHRSRAYPRTTSSSCKTINANFVINNRNAFYGTWYPPHSSVHNSVPIVTVILHIFHCACTKRSTFPLPVLNLTSPQCSSTPTDGCHPIFLLKNLTTFHQSLPLKVMTFLLSSPHNPIFPRRLSSVLSKFSHKN